MAFDRERLRAILGDAVSDDLLGDVLKAHSQSVSQDKGRIDRMQAELDAYAAREAEWEQQRQASMTDQERLQAALDAAQRAQADFARKSARLDAEQAFVAAGMQADQYGAILDSIVSEDAKATVANAEAIVALVRAQAKAASEQAVQGVLQGTPQPQAGSDPEPKGVTKADFDAMTFSEKVAFKADNPEAFASLMQQ